MDVESRHERLKPYARQEIYGRESRKLEERYASLETEYEGLKSEYRRVRDIFGQVIKSSEKQDYDGCLRKLAEIQKINNKIGCAWLWISQVHNFIGMQYWESKEFQKALESSLSALNAEGRGRIKFDGKEINILAAYSASCIYYKLGMLAFIGSAERKALWTRALVFNPTSEEINRALTIGVSEEEMLKSFEWFQREMKGIKLRLENQGQQDK